MRFEIIQFIVPLAFLAVWALTALLNRDAQPLPARPASGKPSDGFGRSGSTAGGLGPNGPARYLGANDRLTASAEPKTAARWAAPGSNERSGGERDRRTRSEDALVIIENDSRPAVASRGLSGAAPRGTRSQTSRRGARGRSNISSTPAKSAEPTRQRALSGLVNQSLAQGKARPLEITPLASPLVPIDLPLAQSISSSVTTPAPTSQPALPVTSAVIRTRLTSAASLREIAILSEILQPPVSVRQRGRGR